MSTAPHDQSQLLWNAPPAPRTKAREPESLWRLTKDGHVMTAGLRYHGEYGVEVQLMRDGELFFGRRFDLGRWRSRRQMRSGRNTGRTVGRFSRPVSSLVAEHAAL